MTYEDIIKRLDAGSLDLQTAVTDLCKEIDTLNKKLTRYRPTPEHRAKISATKMGVPRSQETKDKIAAAHKGRKRPPFSEEWKANMRAAHARRKLQRLSVGLTD